MNMKTLLFIFISLFFSSIFAQTYQNVQIDNSGAPEEPSIAINPKNPNQLIAGANINFYYYSSNSGLNWSKGTLVDNTSGVWGDPCMFFDTIGNSYFIHLSNPPAGWWIDRIVCAKSTNFGVSYINPGTYMGHNPNGRAQQDKAWQCVDWTHGPRGNWINVAWTQFDAYNSTQPNDSSRILFSRSTDAGATWLDPPIRINGLSGDCIDDDNTMEGAVPAVGPNGELYVGWAGPKVLNSQYGIYFQKSTDGGNTWLSAPTYVCDQKGGWGYDINGIYRANGLPVTCCDISNGPNRGTIYINYTDEEPSSAFHDVKLVKSTDGGVTWSTPIRVNNDPFGKEQFFTWMCMDQSTGYLYFVFYDRRNYSDNLTTDVFMARSRDGGATFTNFQVSRPPFVPNAGTFFGDYTNVTASGGHVRPIWAKLNGGQLSVWTAIIEFPVFAENENHSVPKSFSLSQNYPNPFNPSTTVKFSIPPNHYNENITLRIYDMLGKEVSTLVNENGMAPGIYEITWHAENNSSGIYFCTMRSDNFTDTKKMILMK